MNKDKSALTKYEPTGEGHFDDSSKPSGAATPTVTVDASATAGGKAGGKRKGVSKKAKSIKEKLAIADGGG